MELKYNQYRCCTYSPTYNWIYHSNFQWAIDEIKKLLSGIMTDSFWLNAALDNCLDEGYCKALRLYGRAGSEGRLLRKCSRYIVFIKLMILSVWSDEANKWTYHFLKCSHTPSIHWEMGKVEGCPQPNEDITSSLTSSLSWKIVEDLEFSPKPWRCQFFTAFLTHRNLVKMPPLHKISNSQNVTSLRV